MTIFPGIEVRMLFYVIRSAPYFVVYGEKVPRSEKNIGEG